MAEALPSAPGAARGGSAVLERLLAQAGGTPENLPRAERELTPAVASAPKTAPSSCWCAQCPRTILALGRPGEAEPHLRRAVAPLDPTFTRDHASMLCDLATARVGAGPWTDRALLQVRRLRSSAARSEERAQASIRPLADGLEGAQASMRRR